jgi:hypothetical protein
MEVIMQSRFSQITAQLQKELPTWFEMRKNPLSVGAQFLNVFGLQYDDIEFYLQYAFDNYFIDTLDLNAADIVYKAALPNSLTEENRIEFYAEGVKMNPCRSLKEFFEGFNTKHLERKEVFYPNPYYIDWPRQLVYIKKAYDVDKEYPEGKIEMLLRDTNGNILFRTYLPTVLHHVWNFFDEFGLLLDCQRLYGERNREYKERLLDVFRRPGNSTRKGLQNDLARELGLYHKVKWLDGGVDLLLRHSNIVLDSIRVDSELFPESETYFDRSDRLLLKGDPQYAGRMREVEYIAGLSIHAFHDKRDTAFQKDLYSIDRVATPMLQYYVDIITNQVPVMWDQFIWNESFWDIANQEMSGFGYIPSYFDARFTRWKNYKA